VASGIIVPGNLAEVLPFLQQMLGNAPTRPNPVEVVQMLSSAPVPLGLQCALEDSPISLPCSRASGHRSVAVLADHSSAPDGVPSADAASVDFSLTSHLPSTVKSSSSGLGARGAALATNSSSKRRRNEGLPSRESPALSSRAAIPNETRVHPADRPDSSDSKCAVLGDRVCGQRKPRTGAPECLPNREAAPVQPFRRNRRRVDRVTKLEDEGQVFNLPDFGALGIAGFGDLVSAREALALMSSTVNLLVGTLREEESRLRSSMGLGEDQVMIRSELATLRRRHNKATGLLAAIELCNKKALTLHEH